VGEVAGSEGDHRLGSVCASSNVTRSGCAGREGECSCRTPPHGSMADAGRRRGKLGRVPAPISRTRENHVDFVGVMETKKKRKLYPRFS
jgi:hypothetical protein